ncbi:unnamed protein product [Blepharisma stoltei]|uniref:Uncharacterized protein n=1 Tax=Blepharisma stoltei TaxID=1481888 RepID=A0AAU9K3T6_9CILI|nr:unnamed protein product [Blepharisma stoltei]
MDTQVIIGGLVACLGLGYLAYRYSDDGTSGSIALTRDDVVRILKELRTELMNVYMQISGFVMSIREQMGGRIPDEYIKEIIMSQTPINEQLSKVVEKVLQKNSTTKEEFEKACTVTFAGDSEIDQLMKDAKKALEDSFAGITPTLNEDLPSFLTSELTLKIFSEMNSATLVSMYDIIEDIKSKGITNPNSPEFQMEFQRQSPKIEAGTFKVFEKYGLTELSSSANLLMQTAIQKYSKTDRNFAGYMSILAQQTEPQIQAVMTGRITANQIEALRSQLYDEPKVIEIEEENLIQELENPREVKEEEFENEDLLEGEVAA